MTLKALDLFCGLGGFSWSLQATDVIEPMWAVDIHSPALEIYQKNFLGTRIFQSDLSRGSEIRDVLQKIQFYGGVDVVVGGSPCQSFTQIRNGQNIQVNSQNYLVMKFAEIVRELEPLLFIYENVPQLAKFNIFSKLLSRLRGRKCYQVTHAVIEAANFGTPSRRRRLFVVGFRQDLDRLPIISKGLNIPHHQFWWHREIEDGIASYSPKLLEPWRAQLLDSNNMNLVNAEQALSDLPVLEPGTVVDKLAYATEPNSAYQKWARKGCCKSDGHVAPLIRPETQERLKAIVPGGNWRDLPKPLTYKVPHDPTSERLRRCHYSAYRRLLPEGHSPTVQGHSDFAYHYQYERALTPRELARLMGFSDNFRLGSGYEALVRAIGNAVPPRLVTELTNALLKQIGYSI